ncbi:MAG TPA: NAD(P)-dependent alcohol dehydrogenase [Longimicrobiales bacterium]|nr:NAD(P)-dependent alcohol dehydrogenase [Longimicrobiales bacterium]
MKAAIYERYGPPEVVEVRDVPKPQPGAGEVLIRVHATTVTTADWRARSLEMPAGFGTLGRLVFGVRGPRKQILGSEVAGVVEAVGEGVTRSRVGDEVFAFDGYGMGGHAEYKRMRETGPIARKPANLSFEEAAALSFGGTTALHFLRKAKLQSGERVLVNGASGGVGTAVVQIARHLGADVTAVCSAANADLVRSLGAQRVIDYTTQDFAASGESWDVIVDTVGTAPYARSRRALREGGRLLLVLAPLSGLLGALWVSMTTRHKVIAGPAPERPEDLRALAEMAEQGAYRPFIDRTFRLDQIVDAHRLVDSGRKRGNVVVTVLE